MAVVKLIDKDMRLKISWGVISTLLVSCFATTTAMANPPMLEQWFPGSFVQVRVVERAENESRWIVEVTEVFTGSPDLAGERVVIDRTPAHRMPPDRLVVYGAWALRVDDLDVGRDGIVWMTRRRDVECPMEYSFVRMGGSELRPLWKPLVDHPEDTRWEDTLALMRILAEWSRLPSDELKKAMVDGIMHQNRTVVSWCLATLRRMEKTAFPARLREMALQLDSMPEFTAHEVRNFLSRMGSIGKPAAPDEMLWSETVVVVEVIDTGKAGGRGLGAPNPPPILGRAVVTRVITGDATAGDAFAVVPDWYERFSIGGHFLARVPRDEDALLLVTEPQNYSWNVNMPIEGPWNEDGPTKYKSRLEPEEMIDDWLPWLTKAAETPKSEALEFFRKAAHEAPWPVAQWAAAQAMAVDPLEALAVIDVLAGNVREGDSLRLLILQDWMRTWVFGMAWEFESTRGDLLERIVSMPLSDVREAALLSRFLYDVATERGGLQRREHWRQVARAARTNTTWQTAWPMEWVTEQLDFLTWGFTRGEAISSGDAADAVDWLVERWSRRPGSGSNRCFSWGSTLAFMLPLTEAQVAELRGALAASPGFAGEEADRQARIEEIRVMTWDEIGALRWP